MRIMILGASGYLGKKLFQYLYSRGYSVTGVYRKIPKNVKGYSIHAEIQVIQRELKNRYYDWIINCVAVYESKGIPLHEVVDANMLFALRVLDCAVECGVNKFLTIDTGLPKEINLYSFTKKQFAEFGKFYAYKHELTFVNVVLEMFYGEDEPEGRFLTDCCRKMICGEKLLLTTGTQKRDIIYIEDVCGAIELLLNVSLLGFCNVPVGSGSAVPIREIVEYMHKVLKSTSNLYFGAIQARSNEPDCVANMDFLQGLGFELRYPWKKGIEHLCMQMEKK